jgi:hypothetical protein
MLNTNLGNISDEGLSNLTFNYIERLVFNKRWTRAFNLCVNAIIGKTKTDVHQSTK